MYRFFLFLADCLKSTELTRFGGKWRIPGFSEVRVRRRTLGPASFGIEGHSFRTQQRIHLRMNLLPEEDSLQELANDGLTAHVFLRFDSGFILVDTNGRAGITHSIMDTLEQKIRLKITSLHPSSESWLEFVEEGELLEALVASRWGLEDILQSENFKWEQLETGPLVSASVSFTHKGQYQVRVGSGMVTVYDQGIENRLEHASQLMERHLLNGENLIESKPEC